MEHGSIDLIDTTTMKAIGAMPYQRDGVPEGIAFSPNSRTLAVTSRGYVQLWEVQTQEPESQPFRAHGSRGIEFWAAAFSPDGSMLATGGLDSLSHGNVFLWDVATGRLIGQLPQQKHPVSAVNFTPDGALLVASTGWHGGGDVIVWNVDENRLERVIPADDSSVFGADISNGGATLATDGSSERLWNLATGKQLGPSFNGPPVGTVDLSSDGRTLVASGEGGQVIMWDVATGTALGRPFPGPGPEEQVAAAFTPDGRRLFIVSDTGQAWVWDVDPVSWESRACQIAGRSLTQAEWQLHLPDRPYRATCGS